MLPVRPEIVPLSQLDGRDALAVIAYGAPAPGALMTIDVPQLGEEPMVEVWRAQERVVRGTRDGVDFAATYGVLIGAVACEDADPKRAALCVYDRLIRFARHTGNPHLLRVWNHVRDINEVESELERYRAFCAGRHDAFMRHGYAMRSDLPAASAIGTRRGGVMTYFVASDLTGTQVENPRQMSAYDYPPQYGYRSPSFSRATVGHGLVFVSGTASIVGHETKHAGDVARQVDETLTNIESILRATGAGELLVAKVYLRNAGDYALVSQCVRHAMPRTQTIFLHADICRRELLVEIDGVAAA